MTSPISVLIVEDESIIAEELRRIVLKLGYQVLAVAHRYLEVVTILQQKVPDIVLLDIVLSYSDNDGIDLATYINDTCKAPFIYITGNADPGTVARAKHTGPAAYITKPFNADLIYSNIEIALHKKKLSEKTRHTIVKQGSKKIAVDVRSIKYLRADNLYTEIHTVDCKKYIVREYLRNFLSGLTVPFIVQVHRSYAVNIHYVEYYDTEFVAFADQRVPVSESYRKSIRQLLEERF